MSKATRNVVVTVIVLVCAILAINLIPNGTVPGFGAQPQRLADKAEAADVVRQAMESLGERQKMALLLSRFEGMSYQDIAATMELSIPAVKSLLSRARVNLRDLLAPYMERGELPDAKLAVQD